MNKFYTITIFLNERLIKQERVSLADISQKKKMFCDFFEKLQDMTNKKGITRIVCVEIKDVDVTIFNEEFIISEKVFANAMNKKVFARILGEMDSMNV